MKPITPGENISWDDLVKLTPKPPDQPTLGLNAEKRRAEKRFKASPTSLEGKDTGKVDAHVRR